MTRYLDTKFMKRIIFFIIPILFSTLLFVFSQHALHARSNGYSGRTQTGCVSCHQGGSAPQVTLVGNRSLAPNETATYQLLITSTATTVQTHAGFDLTIVDMNGEQVGMLQTSDPDAQISDNFSNGAVAGELIHSQPKANVGGVATVEFQWTAPITFGIYTAYFVGNSVDLNGSPSGDAWEAGSAEIQVQPNLAIDLQTQETLPTENKLIVPLIALVIVTALLSSKILKRH